MPLSMVAVPASVDHDSTKDSPGLIDVGLASKLRIRGVIAARPPRPAGAAAAGACAPCCGAP